MNLSKKTLYPLSATSYELSYFHDHPLKYLATKYTCLSESTSDEHHSANSCCLLFLGGISLNQETWIPIIKSLYELASHQNVFSIESMWTIERPNHGDASLLNEETLKAHYSIIFPGYQYAAAIRNFLASNCLIPNERSNLIAVAHSGGGGSIIQALHPPSDVLPIKRLILVESPFCCHDSSPYFDAMYEIVKASNQRKKNSWSTLDEAMNWMRTHMPSKIFHPDVHQIISETYFRPNPKDPSRFTTKTLPEQETACFKNDVHDRSTLYLLRSILHILPTHLIIGDVHDIWPKGLYEQIEKNIEEDRSRLASVEVIEGAGHYLPVQMPHRTAYEIYQILFAALKQHPARL